MFEGIELYYKEDLYPNPDINELLYQIFEIVFRKTNQALKEAGLVKPIAFYLTQQDRKEYLPILKNEIYPEFKHQTEQALLDLDHYPDFYFNNLISTRDIILKSFFDKKILEV